MNLLKGLPDKKLLTRIDKCSRWPGIGERALGFYLLDFGRRGLHQSHGYAGITQFALLRLQIPTRKTRDLLRIARALEELPLIDRAFACGEISWSAVREITRVAVPETEREWLDLAEKSTLRHIERAVARCSYGDRPPSDPYGLPKTKYSVLLELPAEQYAIWQAALGRLSEKAGGELSDSAAACLMAQTVLERPLEAREKASRRAFQVVYHRCTDCERAWLQTADGPEGVPAAAVAAIEPRAEVIRLPETKSAAVGGTAGAGTTATERGEKSASPESPRSLLTRVNGSASDPRGFRGAGPETAHVALDQRDKPNTPQIRQQVLSRDGHRCAVPGCDNKGPLYAHHVTWKSHGGRTVIDNEIAVCYRCHGLIHDGLLRVRGEAPAGLTWTGANGEPLDSVAGWRKKTG